MVRSLAQCKENNVSLKKRYGLNGEERQKVKKASLTVFHFGPEYCYEF